MDKPVIFIPQEEADLEAAHQFHLTNVGRYLLPRTIGQFRHLMDARALWIAKAGGDVLGCGYVIREDGHPAAEFGGIVVRKDQLRSGLASALGTVAIAAHFLHDPFPLIAHVHVENGDPIDLLTRRLGFMKSPGDDIAISKAELEKELGHAVEMRADASGMIRGDGYRFSQGELGAFATRLETKKIAKIEVEIANRYFTADSLAQSIERLREIATGLQTVEAKTA